LNENAHKLDALMIKHFDSAHFFDEAIGARIIGLATNGEVVK
jgi:hypothetical protein